MLHTIAARPAALCTTSFILDILKTLPLCAMLLFTLATSASAATFYVAPDGSDANPGTIRKPFATLYRAQQEARKVHGQEPVTVFLRGGIYYLSETFTLTDADSGTQSSPVVYRAYRDEKPIVSGGVRLELKWREYLDGVMAASTPPGFHTDQLFVNGELQPMARYPNFDPKAQYFDGYAADAFARKRAARWTDPAGGYIHAMHRAMWGDYHYQITGKDANGDVTYIGGWQNNRQMGMHPEYRFVENIFEELDAPGEWFHNEKTSTLYYYPHAGTDPSKAVIEGVRLRCLVDFHGGIDHPVRFVSFKGITFHHAARTFMDNREPLLRSDWTTYRGGAILFNGSEDCALQDCVIDQPGGNGVFVNNYNRRVAIRDCRISNCGANAIAFVGDSKAVRSPLFEYGQVNKLEDIDRTPGPIGANFPADCLVDDCLIYRSGRVEKQTAGVQIEMSQSITVRHCSIYDVPRAGINIGSGAWGGNVIEYCDIFDTVKETGDHGSFNSWGRDRFWHPNTAETAKWVKDWPEMPFLDVVKPNVLHDNRWRCDHGWDIDLDDGSSNSHIYNNLCLNGGIKNREGFRRTVENNIMVNNGFHPHVWYLNSGDIFRHNIVMREYAPAVMGPPPWGKELDYNLFQLDAQYTPTPALGLQKQSGRDAHSVYADAMFIDPSHGDYRVKPGSPALKLGFKNFPMNNFGVTKPWLRVLARTPELPASMAAQVTSGRDATEHKWLSSRVRNIVGQGEMSAYGTPGETGVLVIDPGSESTPGLAKGDVILVLNGHKIATVDDLKRYTEESETLSELAILVLRQQREIVLKLHRSR